MRVHENENLQKYLNAVCAQVRCREVHADIREELTGHIDELVGEYTATGVPVEEAIPKAVARMGDPEMVGRQLHQAHRPRLEWSLLAIVGVFVTLQVLIMRGLSGSSLIPETIFRNSLVFSVLGALVATGLYLYDYRRLKRGSWFLFAGTVFILLLTLHLGPQSNGVPFLKLGPFCCNIVGVSPFLFIIAAAGILADWDWARPVNLFWGAGLLYFPLFLCLLYPSLAAGLVYALAFLTLMVVSRARWSQMLGLFAPLVGLFPFILTTHPYAMERFTIFLHPTADPKGAGWLYLQLRQAVQGAGMFGHGGVPPQALPAAHTDFVLAYIVYAFGWIVGLAVVALATAFVIRALCLLSSLKDDYGRLLVVGFMSIFAVQFTWSALMTVGLAPVLGISLPFLSYGGSQMILQMAAVGLVLSVYRRREMIGSPARKVVTNRDA